MRRAGRARLRDCRSQPRIGELREQRRLEVARSLGGSVATSASIARRSSSRSPTSAVASSDTRGPHSSMMSSGSTCRRGSRSATRSMCSASGGRTCGRRSFGDLTRLSRAGFGDRAQKSSTIASASRDFLIVSRLYGLRRATSRPPRRAMSSSCPGGLSQRNSPAGWTRRRQDWSAPITRKTTTREGTNP